jgi:hypothetical protein
MSGEGWNIMRHLPYNAGHSPINLRPFGYCKGVSHSKGREGKPCQAGAKPNGYCPHHQGQAVREQAERLDRNT